MIEKFTPAELTDMTEYDARINAEYNRRVNRSHKKSPSVREHGQAKRK